MGGGGGGGSCRSFPRSLVFVWQFSNAAIFFVAALHVWSTRNRIGLATRNEEVNEARSRSGERGESLKYSILSRRGERRGEERRGEVPSSRCTFPDNRVFMPLMHPLPCILNLRLDQELRVTAFDSWEGSRQSKALGFAQNLLLRGQW